MSRPLVFQKNFEDILKFAEEEWRKEIVNKGSGIFVSSHEILGCLVEETREFEDAIQKNDLKKLRDELADILIIALHGLASIDSGKMDWPKEQQKDHICTCGNPSNKRQMLSLSSTRIDACADCGKIIGIGD